MYLKKILICCLSLFALIITFQKSNAQENGKLDAIFVAKEYSNSIVKILLFDSVAEKAVPGSGYVGRASGFIVTEDGIIFTNKHVIEYCMDYMQYETFNPSDKKISDEMNNYNPSNLSDPEYISIKSIHRAIPIIQVFTDKDENNYKLYQAKLISLDSENFDGAILQIISDMKGNPINEKFHPVPIGNSDETNQGEDICVFGFPAQ
jgi:S1-C subfamily serine protease